MSHTPGPWTHDRTGLILHDDDVIADFVRPEDRPLIAAAPALLAAARAALHLCQSLIAVREGASDDLILSVGAALAKAIAKAEDH